MSYHRNATPFILPIDLIPSDTMRPAKILLLTATLVAACTPLPSYDTHAPIALLPVPQAESPAQETPEWWFRSGAVAAHNRGAGLARARNLILFVGDGMGPTTVAAARILAGQQAGGSGEEHLLSFERFPHLAMVKTYNTDQQTPDSAGTMTAMATGVKTRAGMIGVDGRQPRGECEGLDDTAVPSLVELAAEAGLGTGIVTTTRITHATPAALFAKSAERDWESDAKMPPRARTTGCRDIALQLVEFDTGRGLDVVMGGGRRHFLPAGVPDPEHPPFRGFRLDGRDLIAEWQARYPEGQWAWNQAQFDALDLGPGARILALFEPDHMRFEHDRPRDRAGEPSLAEMTRAAITRLQHEHNGFVLIVEGGRIDHAHHFGNAFRALTDTIAMAEAVAVAEAMTGADDTLILVTADHSHVLSFAGYPRRGNPILGVVQVSVSSGEPGLGVDSLGQPYTTLGYANGPGYTGASDTQEAGPKRFLHEWAQIQPAVGRPNLREVDTTDPDYLQEALVPLRSETHGGEDVTLYARGPGAEAVRGVIEQHAIFHFMVQAHPRLRAHLCERGACEDGVPLRLTRPTAAE